MEYRLLGESGLRISRIGMGCWTIAGGDMWGEQDDAESIRTIHAAQEAGITLFDTAEGYGDGRSEEILGEALKGRRGDSVIASKVGQENLEPERIRRSCEASLRRLGTDRIDLYQIHWASSEVPLADSWAMLERLRDEGKIRELGVCNFGVRHLDELQEIGRTVSDQLPYSLLWRAVEDEILPACRNRGIAVLVYSALLHGLLTGRFASADEVPEGRARSRHFSSHRSGTRHGEAGQETLTFAAIRNIGTICREAGIPMREAAALWVLSDPQVSSLLAGSRTAGQILENAALAEKRLPEDVARKLGEATQELKAALGPNPDMWDSQSRFG